MRRPSLKLTQHAGARMLEPELQERTPGKGSGLGMAVAPGTTRGRQMSWRSPCSGGSRLLGQGHSAALSIGQGAGRTAVPGHACATCSAPSLRVCAQSSSVHPHLEPQCHLARCCQTTSSRYSIANLQVLS